MAAGREELGWFARFALIRREERAACAWAGLYFFLVLASTSVLRPVREQAGIRDGTELLPWLFTGTCIAMLIAHPIYSALIVRFPRRVFVPLFYQFFAVALLVFAGLFHWTPPEKGAPLSWVFFIWFSVFNLFAIAVLRGYLTDVFSPTSAKRVFGVIGVGGTLGAIAGAWFTRTYAKEFPLVVFFLASFALLELAVLAMTRVGKAATKFADADARTTKDVHVEGTLASSVRLVLGSRYLLVMSAVMLLSAMGFTMFYAQQAEIVDATFGEDKAAQREAFATIDLYSQVLTLGLELFVTGRVLTRLGTPLALASLPVVAMIGFSTLAITPTFAVLAVIQVAIRGTNYGLASPARDVLATPLSREVKYRVKSGIETFVWRTGDLVGIWIPPLASIAIPVAAVWAALALWLGRTHERKERELAASAAPAPPGA